MVEKNKAGQGRETEGRRQNRKTVSKSKGEEDTVKEKQRKDQRNGLGNDDRKWGKAKEWKIREGKGLDRSDDLLKIGRENKERWKIRHTGGGEETKETKKDSAGNGSSARKDMCQTRGCSSSSSISSSSTSISSNKPRAHRDL